MKTRHYPSYSNFDSISNYNYSNNPCKTIYDNYHSSIDKRNPNSNSFQLHYRFHSNFRLNNNFSTINAGPEKNYLNQKSYKIECDNEDMKNIIQAIKIIQENQKEIISILKEFKVPKDLEINNVNDKNKNIINDHNKSDLLETINKLKEEYDWLQKEFSLLQQNDEENKKLIESNQKEIENLKNNNKIIIEKDKTIKQLNESLEKSMNEKLDLTEKLNKSNNEITKKDNEIERLKNELKEYKSKSTNPNLGPNEINANLKKIINDITDIKNSIQNNSPNINKNLFQSISTNMEPHQIISEGQKYNSENNNV